jgi:spore coat protein U-like protein
MLLGAIVAGAGLVSQNALAACSFSGVGPVSFGAYNVFSAVADTNVGTVRVRCQGGGAGPFAVTLSTGWSNSYASRIMRSGANQLNYNLYTDSAWTIVWGDGSGISSIQSVAGNRTTTINVYGQIPAGQDAAVGIYTDTIIATVTF